MNADSTVTIGKNATCDLQLDHPTVSGLHAQARLDPSRFLWVRDESSARGMFLKRHDRWVRARLVAVCAGDLLRFGDVEVTIDQITSQYDDDVDVRLAPTPAPSLFDERTGRYTLRNKDDEPTLNTPTRNPDTGGVEDKNQ
jgi:pSer/pThr/pTyr-binding forkhead associated (FHA) protein